MLTTHQPGEGQFFDIRPKKRREGIVARLLHGAGVVDLKPTIYRRYRAWVVGGILLAVLSFFAIRHALTRAEVGTFYAGNCLGTWTNPERAQGRPESFEASSSITEDAAARYAGGPAQIFCGKFVDDTYEAKGEIKNVSIAFVWRVGEETVAATSSLETASPASSSTPASVEAPIETPAVPEAGSSGTTTVPSDQSWLRVLNHFLRVVRAQEAPPQVPASEPPAPVAPPAEPPPATPVEMPSQDPAPAPTETVAPAAPSSTDSQSAPASSTQAGSDQSANVSNALAPHEEDIASSTESSAAATSTPLPPPEPPAPDEHFLVIKYNADGEHWVELAKVSPETWSNFTVTLPVANWEELRRIQISVEGIPTSLENVPPVYLDGEVIEVQYDTPAIDLKNETENETATVSQIVEISPSVTIETPIRKTAPVLPEPEIVSAEKREDRVHVVVRYPGPFVNGQSLNVFLYPVDAVFKRNSPDAGFSFEEALQGPFIDAIQLFEKDFNAVAEAEFDVIAPNANPDYGLDAASVPPGTYALDIAYYDGYTWHLTQKKTFVWVK